MSSGVEALRKLAAIGYRARLEGESIRLRYEGAITPNLGQVRPLLALVKEQKAEVIDYLARKLQAQPQEHVTCFECAYFRPAVGSPNPTQAWGHCLKRNKGRYGVAKACAAVLY